MSTRAVVSLFAGIGGFELAAKTVNASPVFSSEIDVPARAVLKARFPETKLAGDIRELTRLPKRPWLVAAGFPCQDLSSVGLKSGITGTRSSLVDEVFRLLETCQPEWVILENVMFMLHVDKGEAMRHVIEGLESLGFNWAYRLLNTSEFGLPQRRRRVYFVASRRHNAAMAMFPAGRPSQPIQSRRSRHPSYGFYWTEGTYATGLTLNGVPPLKAGSTVGIPSPPAILFASGFVGTPTITDAERLQGFRAGWTGPAEKVARASLRWKLVGNAVSVPVARAVIRTLPKVEGHAGVILDGLEELPQRVSRWPEAAYGRAGRRVAMPNDRFPGHIPPQPIHAFLRDKTKPLSAKAAAGFLSRARKGGQRLPEGFLERIEDHIASMVTTR
jgi:DNA (cytosine-5)-methyltransferase 1